MTRELKLALIVGFSLVLAVTVLISDHLSKARQVKLAQVSDAQPAMTVALVAEPPASTLPGTEEPPVPLPPRTEPAASEGAKTSPVEVRPEVKPEVVHLAQGKGPTGGTTGNTLKDRTPEVVVARKEAGRTVDPNAELLATAESLGHSVRRNGDAMEIVLNPNAAGSGKPGPVVPAAAPVAAQPGERAYVVVDGDNFTKVAKKLYGDGGLWKKLAEANSDRVKGDALRVGVKLRVPSVEALTGKAATPSIAAKPGAVAEKSSVADKGVKKGDKAADTSANKSSEKAKSKKPEVSEVKYASYTVKKGDTLGTIAQRTLGSSSRADELVKVNSSVLEDVDTIPIGAVIRVPQS